MKGYFNLIIDSRACNIRACVLRVLLACVCIARVISACAYVCMCEKGVYRYARVLCFDYPVTPIGRNCTDRYTPLTHPRLRIRMGGNDWVIYIILLTHKKVLRFQ